MVERSEHMSYLIFTVLLLLSGCKSEELEPFPTRETYYFKNNGKPCAMLPIISNDPIKLGDPVTLQSSECPSGTIGIEINQLNLVRDWVKKAQELARKNCN